MIVHAYDFFHQAGCQLEEAFLLKASFFSCVWSVFLDVFFYMICFNPMNVGKPKKNVVAQKKHSLFADFTLLYHLEGMFATCCNHTLEEMFIIGFNICSI